MAFELPTNFSGPGNTSASVDGLGSLFTYATYATGGWFGTGLVLMIFMIAFAVGSLMNIGRAFASASFIAFVFSVYFARINAVSPTLPFILLFCVIVGFFWAKGERSASY